MEPSATGLIEALKDTAIAVQSQYPEAVWAKKASIWGAVE
jgi:hypothetical protein